MSDLKTTPLNAALDRVRERLLARTYAPGQVIPDEALLVAEIDRMWAENARLRIKLAALERSHARK